MQLRRFTETLSLTPKQWVQGKTVFFPGRNIEQDQQTKVLKDRKEEGEERRGEAKDSAAHSAFRELSSEAAL